MSSLQSYLPQSKFLKDKWKTLREQLNCGIQFYDDAAYLGEISDMGLRDGIGILIYKTSRVYEGEWFEDKRQGRGFELYQNGNIYMGEFNRGKAEGKGKYIWTNGETYEGEWY